MSRRLTLWTAAPAALAAVLVLVATARWGPGLSPDSAAYVSAARGVVAGEGFVSYTGHPYVHWPPLYPLALAAGLLAGLEPETTARIVHALAFSLTVLVSAHFFALDVSSTGWVVLGAFTAALAVPLLQVSVMLWSEPLFILLVVLTSYWLRRAVADDRWTSLLIAAAWAALAALQRYTGLFVVALGPALLVLEARGPLGRRLFRALLFATVATAPLAVWMVRNLVIGATITGSRGVSVTPFGDHLVQAADVVTGWFLPPRLPLRLRIAVVLVAAALVAVTSRSYGRDRGGSRRLAIAAIAAVVYLGGVIGSLSLVDTDPAGTRLLSPAYPWLLGFIVIVLDQTWSRFVDRRRPLAIALAVGVALWLGYQGSRVLRDTITYAREGSGSYRLVWATPSPTLDWLRASGLPGRLYSNAPDAIYLFTGRREMFARELLEPTDNPLPAAPRHLVWFDRGDAPSTHGLRAFRARFTLEPVARFEDGTVFRLRDLPQ